jgi:hypothetical protein
LNSPVPTFTRYTLRDLRLPSLSPMSPTQTVPPPPGASASTSTVSTWKSVIPAVFPVFRLTVNSLEGLPESLVVTTNEPRSTRPLDSAILRSWKVTTGPSSATAADAGTIAPPTSSAAPMARHIMRIPLGQQLRQLRLQVPRGHQCVVLALGPP